MPSSDLPSINSGSPLVPGSPGRAATPSAGVEQPAPLPQPTRGIGAILRRHLPLILACAALGAAAAAYITWRMDPVYRATASVRIDSRPTQLPALDAMGLVASNPVLTEMEMLSSRSLAQRVADSLGVSAGWIQAVTSVRQRDPKADIIDVSVRAGSPEVAASIATALVVEYIDGRHDARRAEAVTAAAFLREQKDRVAQQLASAESELREFREREGIVSLQAQASSGIGQRAQLEAQRNALEAERAALQALLVRTRRESARSGPAVYRELLAFPPLLSTPASGLMSPLMAAEERLNDLLARRTQEDPDVQLAQARIGELEREIQTTVSNYLNGLTAQVQALNGLLGQSSAALAGVPAREVRYAQLDREARNTETIFSMLQQRLQEAEIAAAATDQTVRLVDEAQAPSSPEKPKPALYLMLGTLAGTMLGLCGALLVERGNRALYTRREVLAATSLPVLGLIPHMSSGRRGMIGRRTPARALQLASPRAASGARPALIGGPNGSGSRTGHGVGEAGQSPVFRQEEMMAFREAYVWLSTNIRLTLGRKSVRSILITSALPGEGKTTIAINLAMNLAQEGQRVLLVDADMRAGRIAQALGISSRQGLPEVLAGKVEGVDAVMPVTLQGGVAFDVLASDGAVARPTQLLSSRRCRELLDWAARTYDAIIVDTTPINSVADAAVLARNTDAVLFVARSGVSEYPAIAFAMEQLHSTGARVLGAVLNDADLRSDPEIGQAYGYYGRYKTTAAAV
jgi:capsular exopolysaccharide synthesis family protein